GHVTLPKHDKIRQVPMTQRLAEVLRQHRHEKGPRVLYKDSGIKGDDTPVELTQEFAGHADLKTTQRYMHLSPAALEGAIRLLEQPSPLFAANDPARGDVVETVSPPGSRSK